VNQNPASFQNQNPGLDWSNPKNHGLEKEPGFTKSGGGRVLNLPVILPGGNLPVNYQ